MSHSSDSLTYQPHQPHLDDFALPMDNDKDDLANPADPDPARFRDSNASSDGEESHRSDDEDDRVQEGMAIQRDSNVAVTGGKGDKGQ